ncbi:hypothetical protein IC614_00340 [Allosphingosinicella flava]|uniref:Uncharacterized protein n=1 Tax=Allosphingosinicella flava TaxID=2771430 RepID=A0A7T2GKC8_9SPHN|nr:hypothetical protein [Sphingosinicella flava]QPQ55113.1 hypothetical protein IC614_00340 [Sphingosinicella flava]
MSSLAEALALLISHSAAVSEDGTALARTLCGRDEKVIYSCPFNAKIGSVCAAENKIIFRYGTSRSLEAEVTSSGSDGRAYGNYIVGGGGGYQTSIRFHDGHRDYVVFSAVYGELTEIAGEQKSGVSIFEWGNLATSLQCKLEGCRQQINRNTVDALAPDPEEDAFGGWQ